jgi:hypothetical protein
MSLAVSHHQPSDLEFPSNLALHNPGRVAADILRNPAVGPLVISDLKAALNTLGIENSEELAGSIVTSLLAKSPRLDIARHLVAPHRDTFYSAFQGRSLKLAEAIRPAIQEVAKIRMGSDMLFDWGTGDTQVAAALQVHFPGLRVQGGDVIIYHGGKELVPFFKIERNRVDKLPTNSQRIITANYVLHHEQSTDKVFQEFSRLLCKGGRAIVVELIPHGNSEAQVANDLKRLWFSDFMYCVVWHKEDKIPMPGNYRTVESWEDQAADAGLKLVSATPIKGTPLIYCNPDAGRQLLVFEK